MARYPLAPLLSAREFREEAAAREARRALAAVEEAEKAAEAAREELARYREWRPGEERRLFEEIRGKVMELNALDGHREDIQALRNAELQREENCRRAELALAAAREEAEAARLRQAQAARDRRKIEEHRERWRRGEFLREEAAAEAELEDFPTRGADFSDEEAVDEEIEGKAE